MLDERSDEDEVFERIAEIAVSLVKKSGLEVNAIPVFLDFRKPMLYYNAIVMGIPVFIRDHDKYAALINNAIFQMEDFSIFGTGWQLEIAEKNIKELTPA